MLHRPAKYCHFLYPLLQHLLSEEKGFVAALARAVIAMKEIKILTN
jgi:hypothetical protein